MGIGSKLEVEIAEEEFRNAKDEWIRKQLGNPDADENTPGWAEASDLFDKESMSDEHCYPEEPEE